MATTENEYYLRATLLIMKGGVFATRKILYREVRNKGGDLNILLLSHRRKLLHEFHKKQFEKLFPACGETNIDVWDIAMLTGVLLIVFKPTLSDEDRNAVRTIKSNRNKVSAHNPTASLSSDTFEYCRDELEKAITHLCSTFDDIIRKECKDTINSCLSGPLEIKSCLKNMKMFGDTVDLFRLIMDKFDTTGKRLSEEIASARRDICNSVHDEHIKQNSEIRTMVIEAVRKAYHEGRIMKTVKDNSGGSTEKWIDLCEKIIVDITNKVVKKSGGSTEFVDIEKAVLDLLDEINSHDDVEVQGAANGSIILRVICSTYRGLLEALLYIDSPAIQQKLNVIAVALQSHFCLKQPLRVSVQVSNNQLQLLWDELKTDYCAKQKTFRLPIRCGSFGGLEHIWNLVEGFGSKHLEKLAIVMSKHLGTTITLTSAVNLDLYLNVIEEEGLVETVDTKRQVFANTMKKFLHVIGPGALVSLLYEYEVLPKLASNCIMDMVETGGQKEQIFEDLIRILFYHLQHRFKEVSKRHIWILFLSMFMKIYVHCVRIPSTVPKIYVRMSGKKFDIMLNAELFGLHRHEYEYLLKTEIATPILTKDDADKIFTFLARVQEYYHMMRYVMDCYNEEELLKRMSELVNKTRNPLVSEIKYLTRQAIYLYRSGMMTQSKAYARGALCKACFVHPCYEVIEMQYSHVFLHLLQYEQLPTTELRNALLSSGKIGLELLTCSNEYHVYEVWRFMIKLRMAFCLLGLGSNGYLIQSNEEIVIDEASLSEAEYLLQDIARMESFNRHSERRKYMYYFALVRSLILKADYRMAKFNIESLLSELRYNSEETGQYMLVARSYLKEIQDVLESNDKQDDMQESWTEEHPASFSERSDQQSVCPGEEQASVIDEPKVKHHENLEPPINFNNPEKVISDLRQIFDYFINERILQDAQTKTIRKKKRKAKWKQKDIPECIDEPGLE